MFCQTCEAPAPVWYKDGIMHKWANTHKKTMKIYVIDSKNLSNIRVSNSGLDHLVTDFVTFLCLFVFIRFILYSMLLCDFVLKLSKCGLAHLCMIRSTSQHDTNQVPA